MLLGQIKTKKFNVAVSKSIAEIKIEIEGKIIKQVHEIRKFRK